jgi:lysophospholipase L1-like esterase
LTSLIVYAFISGLAFLIGAGLMAASAAVGPFMRRRILRVACRSFMIAGFGLVWASATPLPIWAFVLMAAGIVAWLTAEVGRGRLGTRPLALVSCVLGVLLLGCFVTELPHQLHPRLPAVGDRAIYVVGDSISAGVGPAEEAVWPGILGGMMPGKRVVNLAVAGATCATALAQARQVPARGAYVLVEIGGNDMLSHRTQTAFRRDLDNLLRELSRGDRRLVMFELPLPPLCGGYGRVQRDLASAYGVALIPKRYFASVLMARGDTLDGLHLSERGHRAFAETIAGLLRQP